MSESTPTTPTTPAPSTTPIPSSTTSATPVTVAITRRVRPEDELLMQAWVHAGTSLAERFPGFLGTGWVRPAGDSPEWHMLYRFDSPQSLAHWEGSPERTRWLRSAADLVEHTRVEHRTGIEGWFDEPRERTVDEPVRDAAPPRWKQACVIWLAFFPTNLLFTWLLAPLLGALPLPLRVLAMTLLLTPLMTYLVLPQVTRWLQPWLGGRRTP
ncbi:MAG TPA: antibiotic biosynthesis monooxygenase [Pedococcus sp.]